jgi:hypothetical protein
LFTWNDWRKSFSTKTSKSASCWISFSLRRSTQSFNDILFETTKFTRAKDFFVTAKSSNATIVDDMITSKINVFRFQNAINAKNQIIKKNVCQMFIIKAKCVICEESHDVRNKNCHTHQQKMKKTKSTKVDEISF